ncbi:GPI transamidase component GPI17 [Spathaspora sp. JA1]|nr:GPI transamidase component GPI17 [Spathaspora sp. JA1]
MSESPQKDEPVEKKESVKSLESKFLTRTRTIIAIIIFSSILLLGIPLFISTTTIHRANLPIDEINQLNPASQLQFQIPVYLTGDEGITGFGNQDVYNQQLKTRYPNLNIWSIKLVNEETPENYHVNVKSGAESSYEVSLYDKQIDVVVTKDTKIDEYISSILYDAIFKYELENLESNIHSTIAFPYSSKFNIVFSLLVENGIQTNWEIDQAIEKFKPLLNSFNHIANFSITSQIQYYSKLSKKYQKSETTYKLSETDLPTFVNFENWSLENYDINPTINFLIYFPESNYEGIPLIIENTSTNSFLIPQWGGVAILNKDKPILQDTTTQITSRDLEPIMNIFASQLYQLLGVESLTPKNPQIRIDSLSRLLIVSNIKKSLDNLKSLLKLANTLNEITIPEETKLSVDTSLIEINQAIELVKSGRFKLATVSSSQALIDSERAFFEKKMVQQAYFPNEHKLAVFLPLLGPVGSILLFGILKLISDFKQKRKEKKKQE